MKRLSIITLILLTLVVGCSKENTSPSNPLIGTWVFTNQTTNSYAYPSVLTNNSVPIAQSSWSAMLDSIKITFDGDGHYTFTNFHLPVDQGSYRVAQDSLLIIKPDTAAFVKFNYSSPTFSSGSSVPATSNYSPYSKFHFSTDTIRFKKVADDNLIFSGAWLTKANTPLMPSNDTMILNLLLNNFKKQ